jgi:tripartite-type tricarboxylate transporter receptor subunit TctC
MSIRDRARRAAAPVLLTALAGIGSIAAAAQEPWPSRSIKLVVPLTAGGGVDMMARLTAQHLSNQLGQQIVVENQGGAGGTIAANAVARSRPDGYTLIFQSVSAAVVNALVYKNLPYDPIKDLVPVTLAGSFPLVLVANPDVPAKDLRELIALLKANPGQYSYGSSGVGTMPHLAGELFKSMAGVDIVHVPYRGNSAIMADLYAGRVAMAFDGPPTQLGNIRSGKVRAIAITTAERSPVLPDVTPIGDTLPGYAIPFWTAIFAPAGTPPDIIERIAAETNKAMKHPDVVRRYGEIGVAGIGSSPQELDRFWRTQLDYLGKVVRAAGVKPVE